MELNINPHQIEALYSEYLQEISGIKFTMREVDIMSCVLHNRKEKNIANLLSIKPKTVNSHVYNIMSKLGYNSRDLIIEFAEKSGKLQHLRQYYFCIVSQGLFQKYLSKIAKVINPHRMVCRFLCKTLSKDTKEDYLILKLADYLKTANVNLIKKEEPASPSYNIHVLTENIDITEIEIEKENGTNIILLFNNSQIPELTNMKYIDFRKENDFYYSLLELLRIIINKSTMDDLIKEFKSEYQGLLKSWKETAFPLIISDFQKSKTSILKKLLLIFLMIATLCLSMPFLFPEEDSNVVGKINQEFAEYVRTFSSDNITQKDSIRGHYKMLEKVSSTVSLINNKYAQEYFMSKNLSLDELLNCLYVLHSLSNQYINYNHDYASAIPILLQAKKLAENYVQQKSKVKLDFDELTKEEIFVEFNIVSELTELYTRILYLLGRTYIYSGELGPDCKKYFLMSQYLGKKLGIFEGYLSSRSGLETIQRQEIDDDIKNGHYDVAASKLKDAIELAHEALKDNQEYTINYKPGYNVEKIIPSEDTFNKVYYIEQILKFYTRLIMISNDNQQIQDYIKEISLLFCGDKNTEGLLILCEQITQKRAACVYNSLGNILLKFYENKVNFDSFKDRLIKLLSLESKISNDLDFIEKMFCIAKLKSRNTDYSKADSYDGLARVYEKKLEQSSDLSLRDKLQQQIYEFKAKRDNINDALGRKNQQLRQHNI